jgi:hypothetical protein
MGHPNISFREKEKRQSFDGASPIVFGPRTLVRTWGTRVDL